MLQRRSMGTFAERKQQGNQHFLRGELKEASAWYVRALGAADTTDELRLVAYGNLAQCELRQSNARQALQWCEQGLALNPRHVKTLYRKACALDTLRDDSGAISALNKALRALEGVEDEAAGTLKVEMGKKLAALEQRQAAAASARASAREAKHVAAAIAHQRVAPSAASKKVATPYAALVAKETSWEPWLRREVCR